MTPSALLRPLTALVADSNPYAARVARDVLVRSGYARIVEARDGAEALGALVDGRPDLLVVDWQLPVISAREVVEAARDTARSHCPTMPVVVTMPEPTAGAVSAATALGVDAILARPFAPRDLRLRLERIASAAGTALPKG